MTVIAANFLENVENFCQYLFSPEKICIKRINDAEITAADLSTFFRVCSFGACEKVEVSSPVIDFSIPTWERLCNSPKTSISWSNKMLHYAINNKSSLI